MPETFGLPGQIKLSNREGKTIKALVVARGPDHIRFMRVDTGDRFAYPIDGLNLLSRLKVMRYPATLEPPAVNPDLRTLHKEGLIAERQRLQRRINELNGRLSSQLVSSHSENTSMTKRADQRGLVREMERIQERINSINKSLAALGD